MNHNNLLLLLCFPFLLTLFYLVTKHLLHKAQNRPPSPFFCLPIMGHLFLLRPDLHRRLAELAQTYGPTLHIQIGSWPVLVVSSPTIAKECLSHKNDVVFANRPDLLLGSIIGYNNTMLALAPHGDHWRNLRRISAVEFLSSHRLRLLSTVRSDEIVSIIQRLYRQCYSSSVADPKVEVNVTAMVIEMVHRVTMKMIVGDQGCKGDKGKRFKKVLEEIVGLGGVVSKSDVLPILKMFGVESEEKERLFGIHNIGDKLMQEILDEYRELAMTSINNSSSNKGKSMVEVLLELQQVDPKYYNDDIIKGLLLILLIAGAHTSATTMEWTLSLLLNNPTILKKAKDEIENHVGHDRLIEESDLSRLHYLNCIINETLRMYPATPLLLPHKASQDCIINGYNVTRGTILVVNAWHIHNDPKIWDEPSKFKPERFDGMERNQIGNKVMAFGLGRRKCPGENLAIRTMGLTLGLLIQCFKWERNGEELVDMEEKFEFTLHKVKPLKAKLQPQQTLMMILV